jgi:hypothetical protein
VEVLNTSKVVAPGIQVLVRYGNGVDAVTLHQWVFGSLGSVKVKLFFEQIINGNV